MKPKEKAKQLYEKSEGFIYTSEAHFAEDNCEKNCANIAVDEIINECGIWSGGSMANGWGTERLNYWQEVKNELKKL
jgi:hypothetical protein